jgi:hypothetical protein
VREPDGELRETWLSFDGAAWRVGERALPAGALAAVFGRYGKPLEAAAPPPGEPGAHVSDGTTRVRVFQFMRWGDVEPQAYVLCERDGAEPLAAPAPLVAAALAALATALARTS